MQHDRYARATNTPPLKERKRTQVLCTPDSVLLICRQSMMDSPSVLRGIHPSNHRPSHQLTHSLSSSLPHLPMTLAYSPLCWSLRRRRKTSRALNRPSRRTRPGSGMLQAHKGEGEGEEWGRGGGEQGGSMPFTQQKKRGGIERDVVWERACECLPSHWGFFGCDHEARWREKHGQHTTCLKQPEAGPGGTAGWKEGRS